MDFDETVIFESDKVIKNFDPEVIKTEFDGEYTSVLVKDKNSDFKAWLDVYKENVEWNKFVFHLNILEDAIEKRIMDDDWVFDLASSLAYNEVNKE